jgi:hypothetical protein
MFHPKIALVVQEGFFGINYAISMHSDDFDVGCGDRI